MHKRNRKFAVVHASRPNSDINVTPLVDVVLVLLIIFMVVMPLLDKMIRVRVPDAEQQDQPDKPQATQLVVSISQEGELAINSEKVTDDTYIEKLKRVLAARSAGDRLVFFTADDKALYPRLVVALDGGRQAGAEVLTMTTEPMAAAGSAGGTPVEPVPAPPQ